MSLPLAYFDHVSKRYYIGTRKAFLRELLPDFLSNRVKSSRTKEIWAMKDLSFEVRSGEALGIIGANGSGKTTTLSLLGGITAPTKGLVGSRGRIAALIQLGAGFHPELTGRENIFLNGAILGLKRAQLDRIYDDIVQFAELGAFMDTPVKRYSSGMYARLGFSVSMHIQPDLLLVDEVLAVGDIAFQAKCIERMREFIRGGGAVVFVSHNLSMIQSLCTSALWLDYGRCVKLGPPMEVIAGYADEMDQRLMKSFDDVRERNMGTGDIRIKSVILKNERGDEQADFCLGESLTVEVHFQAARRVSEPYFWIGISSSHGTLFGANMMLDGFRPKYIEEEGMLSCTFKSLPLLSQVYGVTLGIWGDDGATMLVQPHQYRTFRIIEKGDQSALAPTLVKESPPVLVPYEWRFPDGAVHEVNSKARI